MKIFISWSGEKSRRLAEALNHFLNDVFIDLETWLSSEDIDVGAKWNYEISKQLEGSNFGIICLTKENLTAPWILFEAGALAKSVEPAHVCPYLLDLKPIELNEPLSQFQSIFADGKSTLKLLQTINKLRGGKLFPDEKLKNHFNAWWPQLENKLNDIKQEDRTSEGLRSDEKLLEGIIQLVRLLALNRELPMAIANSDRWHKTFLEALQVNDKDIFSFARPNKLDGKAHDPNAVQWTVGKNKNQQETLDGYWLSRWNRFDGRNHWVVR
jgi:hypothetical protein